MGRSEGNPCATGMGGHRIHRAVDLYLLLERSLLDRSSDHLQRGHAFDIDRRVQKVFGDVEVIPPLDLEIEDGEFVVFVGPSGCGKSTLLRMIAGLEDLTTGAVAIDDADVTEVPPSKRGLAMVFQSYALYPHMTVRKNIAFPMRMAGVDQATQDEKIAAAAKSLNLTDYLDRKPGQLSGGQRQRVAIGRAIVREPAAFLFDEPLSNLDAALRVGMRLEIMELHAKLATTMIYVTHDQVEAMTMADKIVVLQAGVIRFKDRRHVERARWGCGTPRL